MSSDPSPYATSTPHGGRAPGPIRWPTLLVRAFLILVPTQLLGNAVGGAVFAASGSILTHPGLSWLVNIGAGLLSGLVLGLILTPTRRQLAPYVAVSAAIGALTLLALLMIAKSQVVGPPLNPTGVILGLLLTIGIQVVASGALWSRKSSR